MQGLDGRSPTVASPVAAALGHRKEFREWARGLRPQGLRVLWTEDLSRLTAIVREEVVLLLVVDEDMQVSARRFLDLLPAEASPIPVLYLSERLDERLRLERLNEGLALSVKLDTPASAIAPAIAALVGRAARQRADQRLTDELLRRATSSERALDQDRRRLSELRSDLQSLARGAESILTALSQLESGPSGAGLLDRVLAERLRALASNIVERTTSITGDLSPSHRIPRIPTPRRNGRRALRLDALAEEVATLFVDSAEASGVEVALETAAGLPEIWGERSRLAQMLIAFVAHAVRYAPQGQRVLLRVDAVIDDGRPSLRLTTFDAGPPPTPSDLERLFDDTYEGGTRSGAGLGFARQVAEEHRGRVTARARAEGGLELNAFIPIDARKAREEPSIVWAKDDLVIAKLVAELRKQGVAESSAEPELDALVAKVLSGSSLIVHGEPD